MNDRIPASTLGLLVVVFAQAAAMWWMTSIHNAQLTRQAERFNAQLAEQTETCNRQLAEQVELHNEQLWLMTERHNAQLATPR